MAGDLSLFWKIQFKRVSFDYSNYISLVNGIELVDSATKRRVDIACLWEKLRGWVKNKGVWEC